MDIKRLCNCEACRCVRQEDGHVQPRPGDHLVSPRRGYTHHGIYAGDGRVLHYSGWSRFLRSGTVSQATLPEFARGRDIHVECRSEQALPPEQIIARALSRLGEDRYHLLRNNCEHFSEWARYGVARSRQVERWTRLARLRSQPVAVLPL